MAEQISKQQEFVLRTIEERNIRFIRLWFSDVLGTLKSVAIAPAELENAFDEGIGFDGSAIEGFARITESDMLAKPDPATFSILPWRTEAPGAARMFCDITMPDGSPSHSDPRNVLRRTLDKAAKMGYTCYTHPEIEFFLFKSQPEKGVAPVPVDQGFYASFMPKPFTDHPGSGMHTHVSLFEGEKNAFFDSSAEFNLSKTGRSFIAGILKHAAEMTAITNQWVNSYKRLQGGGEAPSLINWGQSDRGALVRIPMYKPNKENSTRIELRSLDSACNPYLAFAVMLAAGLKGIEEEYVLEPSADPAPLPANLHEAIVAMEGSELIRQTLGEHVFEFVLRNKRAEWQDYRRQVSAYELDRYLPVL
jgi:glutamine synthetase